MVADYEAAWLELSEYIASKTQHGREATLTRMAEIVASHRVPAGEKSRLLRLYGIEVERTRAAAVETDRDQLDTLGGGAPSPSDGGLSGHHRTEEVHDGRRSDGGGARFNGAAAAACR